MREIKKPSTARCTLKDNAIKLREKRG